MKGSLNPNWRGGIAADNMRYKRQQRARYPERVYARELVRRAVRSGRLERKSCEACGGNDTQAHHDDYAKPLDVRWLCRGCHDGHHAANPGPRHGAGAEKTFTWRGRVRFWSGNAKVSSHSQTESSTQKTDAVVTRNNKK